jgi:putative NADH-flavin reductase
VIVACFGGSGRTGRLLLAGALARGWSVRALARRPEALADVAGVTVLPGDVLDAAAVAETVRGADGVLSALGSAALGAPGEAIGTGTAHIATACRALTVPRVVALAGGGILDLPGVGLRRDRPGYPEVFRPVSAQHLAAWQALEAAGLDWTLVCTPDLTDAPARGLYRIGDGVMPDGGKRIARADVAAVMLEALATGRWSRQRIGLAD